MDVNKEKVVLVNQGKSPVVEEELNELIKKGLDKKLVSATVDYKEAVFNSDISLIIVMP